MIQHLAISLSLSPSDPAFWLPLAFLAVFCATVVAGTLLDGFDIGVGCLSLVAPAGLRPRMLSLLNPWRDANEFWLFFGLGIFVLAFPHAWAAVMGQLSIALFLLALGTLARSVCFEFRLRAPFEQQHWWQLGFALGSVLTAFSHGVLLALVIINYDDDRNYVWFLAFMGFCAVAAYVLLGASWLLMRESGELRFRAVVWGRRAVRWFAAGAVAASVVLSLANPGVLLKWSEGAPRGAVLLLWLAILIGFVVIEMTLQRLLNVSARTTAVPFVITLAIFIAVLFGLAFSFFPFLVLDQITLWDAAADVQTLQIIWTVVLCVLPFFVLFFIWVYWRIFGLSRPPVPPNFKQ